MDSTKSLFLFTRALAFSVIGFAVLDASPVTEPIPEEQGCALDITLSYANDNSISSNLPSLLKDIFSQSANGLDADVEIAQVPQSPARIIGVGFRRELADEDIEAGQRAFTAHLQLRSASACPSLQSVFTQSLASQLGISRVISFTAAHSLATSPLAPKSAPMAVAGTIDVLVADYLDGSFDKFAEVSTDSGEVFVVGGEGAEWSRLQTGDSVELTLESSKNGPSELVVETGSGLGMAYRHAKPRHRLLSVDSVTSKKTESDKSSPRGVNKLLAIRIQYTDSNPDDSCTESCVESNLWTGTDSVAGVYSEASYGALSVPQSYGKIVTVSLSVASTSFSCNDLSSISAAADAAMATQFSSVSLSGYTTRVYLTSAICGIGIAYLNSSPGRAFVHSSYPDTIAHEVGHTLGLQHANRDPGDDNTVDEYYGDRSCIMGYSQLNLRSFNAPHRIQGGWVPSSAVKDLSGCSGKAMTYTISPLSKAVSRSGATVALRATRSKGGKYFISFRNADGYDGLQTSTYRNKVHIHYQLSSTAQTQLIAILDAGQSWLKSSGIKVVVTKIDTKWGAKVTVSYCGPKTPKSLEALEDPEAADLFEMEDATVEDDVAVCGPLSVGETCERFDECSSCSCSAGVCM